MTAPLPKKDDDKTIAFHHRPVWAELGYSDDAIGVSDPKIPVVRKVNSSVDNRFPFIRMKQRGLNRDSTMG